MRDKISSTKESSRSSFVAFRRVTLCCLAYLMLTPSIGNSAQKIIIIQSGSHGVYTQYTQALQEQVLRKIPNTAIKVVDFSEPTSSVNAIKSENADLYIAVGINAAESVAKITTQAPKILGLIPRSAYEENNKLKIADCPPQTCKVLTLDQPIERQLRLLHAALPKAKNILILKNGNSILTDAYTNDVAKKYSLALSYLKIESEDTLVTQLKTILPGIDVLLAIPDNSIYNSATARPILLTTYKYSVPIFAYSQSFIDAGAVVGLYSTPAQHARYAAELIEDGLAGFKKNHAQILPPKYFMVGTNQAVAKSLGLELPDVNSLQLQLEQGEK